MHGHNKSYLYYIRNGNSLRVVYIFQGIYIIRARFVVQDRKFAGVEEMKVLLSYINRYYGLFSVSLIAKLAPFRKCRGSYMHTIYSDMIHYLS